MKVVFKVIKAGSGNDIYFQQLSKALSKANIDSTIEYYPRRFQYFPWLLKFINKRTKGDIIHSNAEYGWVFKEKDKPLYVSLLHNVFDNTYKSNISFAQGIYYNFILRPNIKKSLKLASKVIAISKYTKESFSKEYNYKNIEVIYPGIDTDKFKPRKVKSDDKRFKLLFVGNLIKRKGADLLPQIMKKLGNDYVLYYTSGLRTSIPDDFKRPNMIPLGKLTEDQLIDEYNKCDALLFPTRLEGFGYAVAEAMACGKPVISSNTSSIPEIVRHDRNGLLSNMDSAKVYSRLIKKLSSKKNLYRKFSIYNRQTILAEFSTQKIVFALKNYIQLDL